MPPRPSPQGRPFCEGGGGGRRESGGAASTAHAPRCLLPTLPPPGAAASVAPLRLRRARAAPRPGSTLSRRSPSPASVASCFPVSEASGASFSPLPPLPIPVQPSDLLLPGRFTSRSRGAPAPPNLTWAPGRLGASGARDRARGACWGGRAPFLLPAGVGVGNGGGGGGGGHCPAGGRAPRTPLLPGSFSGLLCPVCRSAPRLRQELGPIPLPACVERQGPPPQSVRHCWCGGVWSLLSGFFLKVLYQEIVTAALQCGGRKKKKKAKTTELF